MPDSVVVENKNQTSLHKVGAQLRKHVSDIQDALGAGNANAAFFVEAVDSYHACPGLLVLLHAFTVNTLI